MRTRALDAPEKLTRGFAFVLLVLALAAGSVAAAAASGHDVATSMPELGSMVLNKKRLIQKSAIRITVIPTHGRLSPGCDRKIRPTLKAPAKPAHGSGSTSRYGRRVRTLACDARRIGC